MLNKIIHWLFPDDSRVPLYCAPLGVIWADTDIVSSTPIYEVGRLGFTTDNRIFEFVKFDEHTYGWSERWLVSHKVNRRSRTKPSNTTPSNRHGKVPTGHIKGNSHGTF